MKRIILLALLIPALAYGFTYKNNAQTGKPDLVTTSVADLTDIGTAYAPYTVFKNYTSTDRVVVGGALGTPSSGTLTNCTFPTLNQNTTGSAATLTTARTINAVSFNGSANIQTATASTSDYTAGTWTPTDASGASLALTVNYAKYIRIGNTVTAQAYIVYPATADTSSININGVGLPSLPVNGYIHVGCHSNTALTNMFCEGEASSTTILGFSGTTATSVQNANMSGKYLLLTFTYLAI